MKSLAQAGNTSTNRVIVDLIELCVCPTNSNTTGVSWGSIVIAVTSTTAGFGGGASLEQPYISAMAHSSHGMDQHARGCLAA